MYEDKKIICKDCGQEFVFTAGEQEFYAFRTSLRDAKLAEMRKRPLLKVSAFFTMQSAQNAARRQRFPLSPLKTDLYTAAIVTLN